MNNQPSQAPPAGGHMPKFLRRFIGVALLFATVGVASCQAFIAA